MSAADIAGTGGTVTDVGYCFSEDYAEFAIESPIGVRLNVRVNRLEN